MGESSLGLGGFLMAWEPDGRGTRLNSRVRGFKSHPRLFSWRVVMLQELEDLWESFWEMVADIIEGVEGD